MNESTKHLYDAILDSDRVFLAAIDADNPDELEETIDFFYDLQKSKGIALLPVEQDGEFNFVEVEWKKLYTVLSNIDDPIDMTDDQIDDGSDPSGISDDLDEL